MSNPDLLHVSYGQVKTFRRDWHMKFDFLFKSVMTATSS